MTKEEFVKQLGRYGRPFEKALEEILYTLKQNLVNNSLVNIATTQNPVHIASNFVSSMLYQTYGEISNDLIIQVKEYFDGYIRIMSDKLYKYIMDFQG